MLDKTHEVAQLIAREQASHHVAGDASCQVGAAEGAAGQVGGLAELVAAGEGEGVHDGEDEGDDWKGGGIISSAHVTRRQPKP